MAPGSSLLQVWHLMDAAVKAGKAKSAYVQALVDIIPREMPEAMADFVGGGARIMLDLAASYPSSYQTLFQRLKVGICSCWPS
jgi:hypothetical protein